MNGILDTLAEIMRNNLWAAPLLSLFAGIITSFTPCSLATVPMLLACVGASKAGPEKSLSPFSYYGFWNGCDVWNFRFCGVCDRTLHA